MANKKANHHTISDTVIDLDSPGIKGIKTLGDLQKLEIFSHLEEDERAASEKQLAKKLKLSNDDVAQQGA